MSHKLGINWKNVQEEAVMELNDTDVKILQSLLADARFSSRQIAKNVGVSVGTVLSRIKKMEDELKEGKEKMSAFEVDYSDLKEASMKAQEALQSLILLVETMVNVPSQAPAEVPNNFKKVSVQTKADRIRNYSNFVSQFKNK